MKDEGRYDISGLKEAQFEPVDFSTINEQKEKYFAAVQAGLGRNYKPMEVLFAEIIENSISASDG